MSLLSVFAILTGCTSQDKRQVSVKVDTYDFDVDDIYSDTILRVDENYVYVNVLDVVTNPFLFTTRGLKLLDLEGNMVKSIPVETDKRIVDFVVFEDQIYYFNLVFKEDDYYIELCQFDDQAHEILIKDYPVNGPFGYPTFMDVKEDYVYKIENTLYSLKKQRAIFTMEDQWFMQIRNPNQEEPIYIKKIDDAGYRLGCIEDGQFHGLSFCKNFGSYVIIGEKIIYQNLDDGYLYMSSLNGEDEELFFDQVIFDFNFLNEKTILATLQTKGIVVMDIASKEVIEQLDSTEILSHSFKWIFSNQDVVCFLGEKMYKISIQE